MMLQRPSMTAGLPLVCAGCNALGPPHRRDEGSWDTVSDRLRGDGQKCRLWAVGCGPAENPSPPQEGGEQDTRAQGKCGEG